MGAVLPLLRVIAELGCDLSAEPTWPEVPERGGKLEDLAIDRLPVEDRCAVGAGRLGRRAERGAGAVVAKGQQPCWPQLDVAQAEIVGDEPVQWPGNVPLTIDVVETIGL